jgi:hypothetical protein
MKRSVFYLLVAMVAMAVSSCKSSSDVEEIERIVGTYSLSVAGSVNLTMDGKTTPMPLVTSGTVNVTRDGEGNRVKVTGVSGTLKDEVTGGTFENNTLTLDSESRTVSESGLTISATVTYKPAKFENNKFLITADLSGTVTATSALIPSSSTGTIDGTAQITATKQ